MLAFVLLAVVAAESLVPPVFGFRCPDETRDHELIVVNEVGHGYGSRYILAYDPRRGHQKDPANLVLENKSEAEKWETADFIYFAPRAKNRFHVSKSKTSDADHDAGMARFIAKFESLCADKTAREDVRRRLNRAITAGIPEAYAGH